MKLLRTLQDTIALVVVSGRLDAMTTAAFEKESLAWVDGGDRRILLDFADLEYISSAGLRGILALAKRARAVGGAVAVCAMTGMVAEVFAISGFDAFIPVAATRDEGLEILRR